MSVSINNFLVYIYTYNSIQIQFPSFTDFETYKNLHLSDCYEINRKKCSFQSKAPRKSTVKQPLKLQEIYKTTLYKSKHQKLTWFDMLVATVQLCGGSVTESSLMKVIVLVSCSRLITSGGGSSLITQSTKAEGTDEPGKGCMHTH